MSKNNTVADAQLIAQAVKNGVSDLRELISNGSDINTRDEEGRSPLHIVVSQDALSATRALLAYKADIHAQDKQGDTPLHVVVTNSKNTTLINIVASKGDIAVQNKKGDTPLHAAVLADNMAAINALVGVMYDRDKNIINTQNYNGKTPLHLAAAKGSIEVAKKLIQQGADVNATDKDGNTPLTGASEEMQAFLRREGAVVITEDAKKVAQEKWQKTQKERRKKAVMTAAAALKPSVTSALTPEKELKERLALAATSDDRIKAISDLAPAFKKKARVQENLAFVAGAVGKLKRAFPVVNGKFDPDCVPVKIKEVEGYVGEVFDGQQRNDGRKDFRSAPPLSDEERKERRITVNNSMLFDNKGKVVDTSSDKSKGKEGMKAFVLGKDEDLYTFTHGAEEGRKRDNKAVSTLHGTVLDERPVAMAGMMEIKSGKITKITYNSGHYRPNELDMYRCVQILQKQGVLAEGCMIDDLNNLESAPFKGQPVKDFMQKMEAPKNGVPYYISLRENRILENTKYNLNYIGGDASKILKDANHPKDYKDKYGNAAMHWIFERYNTDRIKRARNLIENEFVSPEEERAGRATVDKEDKRLADDIESLVNAGYNVNVRNNAGSTSMDLAVRYNIPAAIKVLGDHGGKTTEDLKQEALQKVEQYFKDAKIMLGKRLIDREAKNAMKEDIAKILKPLAISVTQEDAIKNVSGAIVRDVFEERLSWKQRLTKFFSISSTEKLALTNIPELHAIVASVRGKISADSSTKPAPSATAPPAKYQDQRLTHR